MPKVDPMSYLIEAVGRLTGGLITDLQTLFLGMVVCSFILMALDLLKDVLLSPVASYQRAREIYHDIRIKTLPAGPTVYNSPASERQDIEISPLRQYELDLAYRGADSLPESEMSIYDQKQNAWERDGVELSEDRYRDLESALDEAIYNDRMQHRMSGDDVESMFTRMRREG
jgi:hypothetical protein